jgi:hypothetical protein
MGISGDSEQDQLRSINNTAGREGEPTNGEFVRNNVSVLETEVESTKQQEDKIQKPNVEKKQTAKKTEIAKSKFEGVVLTLRGGDNEEKTIEIEITEDMSNQDALNSVKEVLKANKFGVDGYNYLEIPYHPKLVGIINTLKKSLPEGTTLGVIMPEDFSSKIVNIDKDSLKKILEDFEQADTIIFRNDADKQAYIALLPEGSDIERDDSKYQVKSKEDIANLENPINKRNENVEKSNGVKIKTKNQKQKSQNQWLR